MFGMKFERKSSLLFYFKMWETENPNGYPYDIEIYRNAVTNGQTYEQTHRLLLPDHYMTLQALSLMPSLHLIIVRNLDIQNELCRFYDMDTLTLVH